MRMKSAEADPFEKAASGTGGDWIERRMRKIKADFLAQTAYDWQIIH